MGESDFSLLDEQAQKDLLEWLNIVEPDAADRRRLAILFDSGGFGAWDCPTCGERCYHGDPENWDHFQGVWEVDHISYPGDPQFYAPAVIAAQCNSCRMNLAYPGLYFMDEIGTGPPDAY